MINIIKNFKISQLNDTKFVHPVKITFEQNGKEKTWEAVKSHDSVAILLYHEEKDSFLLVKQFRAPVYLNDKSKTYTYELCAGLVDKDKSLLKDILRVTSFYTNVGVSGGCQHLFFAKIDESMKIHKGGGINDEQIELHFLPIEKSDELIFDESKAETPGLMFSFYWIF